ncbi:PepSY domain-containing protein [Mesorhizobium onobrychidis]|uniref:PepSY domain-containing protein n=1 Tax=Mesorhizobium onobrychidis TaxID=2775404 RepID=A0ABY5RA19_9HYPH|nr:PepSY domain-containing protein [Mesorhizobium onobrychidis]
MHRPAAKSDVGIAEWQPRQAVLTKLEAERRHLRSIKTEDGWSDAAESKGRKVETHFDRETSRVWVVPAKRAKDKAMRHHQCLEALDCSTVASRPALCRYSLSTKYDRRERAGHPAEALIIETLPIHSPAMRRMQSHILSA